MSFTSLVIAAFNHVVNVIFLFNVICVAIVTRIAIVTGVVVVTCVVIVTRVSLSPMWLLYTPLCSIPFLAV